MSHSTHRQTAVFLTMIVAAFGPVPTAAWAQKTDLVTLRNGDRVTGEVKQLVSGRLQYKTDAANTIYIEWDHVVALESSLFFEVLTNRGTRYYGALLPPTTPGTIRVGTDTSGVDLPLGQVASIERLRQTFWSRLKGSFDVGYSFTSANTKSEFTVNAQTRYRTRRGKWQVSLDSLSRRQESAVDVNRNQLTGSYQYSLSGRWILGASVSGQDNSELNLDLRLLLSIGAGYHVVRTVEHDLVALVGVAGLTERFSDDRDQEDSTEALLALMYELYALGARDFTINATAVLSPSITVKGRVRADASINVRKELVKDFYISLRFFDNYDNSVQNTGTSSKNDYGVTTSIGWSF